LRRRFAGAVSSSPLQGRTGEVGWPEGQAPRSTPHKILRMPSCRRQKPVDRVRLVTIWACTRLPGLDAIDGRRIPSYRSRRPGPQPVTWQRLPICTGQGGKKLARDVLGGNLATIQCKVGGVSGAHPTTPIRNKTFWPGMRALHSGVNVVPSGNNGCLAAVRPDTGSSSRFGLGGGTGFFPEPPIS